MRGLKPVHTRYTVRMRRRIFYRCVDWNPCYVRIKYCICSRIFYRCVDWNSLLIITKKFGNRRIFYRCVDWNTFHLWKYLKINTSHLLQMRGLKPNGQYTVIASYESHLLQMRGLKHYIFIPLTSWQSRIFYRCVDWNWTEKVTVQDGKKSHLLQMRGLKLAMA